MAERTNPPANKLPSRRKGVYTRDGQPLRRSNDWYPTPASYREALRTLLPLLPSRIVEAWEPAAGDGQLLDTLADLGFSVWGSDIAPARSDIAELDFLANAHGALPPRFAQAAGLIVTNPPFHLLDRFIDRCLDYLDHQPSKVRAVVLFMPWASLAADRRTESFRRSSVILRMPWRTRFFRPADGASSPAGTADFCWVMWTIKRPKLGPVVVTVPKPPTAVRHLDGERTEFDTHLSVRTDEMPE